MTNIYQRQPVTVSNRKEKKIENIKIVMITEL